MMRDNWRTAGEANAIADIFSSLGYGRDLGNSIADSGLQDMMLGRDEKLRMAAGDQASKLYSADSQYAGELARAQAAAYQADNALAGSVFGSSRDAQAKESVANIAGQWAQKAQEEKARALIQAALYRAMAAKAMGGGSQQLIPAGPKDYMHMLGPQGQMAFLSKVMKESGPKASAQDGLNRYFATLFNAMDQNPRTLIQSKRQMPMGSQWGASGWEGDE